MCFVKSPPDWKISHPLILLAWITSNGDCYQEPGISMMEGSYVVDTNLDNNLDINLDNDMDNTDYTVDTSEQI